MPEPSLLDVRLAEIDRRLRLIQSGLEPVDEPGGAAEPEAEPEARHPSLPPEPPEPRLLRPPVFHTGVTGAGGHAIGDDGPAIATLTARLHELAAVHERLLSATQELLIDHADALARAAPVIGVSAGPFADPAEVEAFRGALAALPQVGEVAVREYAGDERVVLDVHLRGAIS
jgi:hypothetical protein